MNVQALIVALSEALSAGALPGWKAQSLACPPGRPTDLPERIRDARRAGVVCLLCWHDHQWCVMLILRAQDNSPHSGQLAFPGGAAEAKDGGDLTQTALRELKEEVGVSLKTTQIMGKLSPIYIPPSHFYVQPVVACCLELPELVLQEDEVAEAMFVPLSDLPSARGSWPTQRVSVGNANVLVPGWPLGNHVLWGATAMVMSELLMVCDAAGFGLSFAPSNLQE